MRARRAPARPRASLRAQAEEPVGVPLQLGEVVEQRRREPPRLGLDRLDRAPRPRSRALDDRRGLRRRPAGRRRASRSARLPRPRRGTRCPRSVAPASCRRRRERGDDLEVVLGHEARGSPARARPASPASASARARRRGARRCARRVGAREVHADEPVGAAAAAGGVGEGVVVARRRAGDAKPSPDRVRGERRDPEPLHRLAAAGRLVDVAEDQLALAPGVGGAHDLASTSRSRRTLLHDLELRPRVRSRTTSGHSAGSIGSVVAPPSASTPGRISCGSASADEVADGPGHDVAAAARGSPRRAASRRARAAMSRATEGFSATTAMVTGRASPGEAIPGHGPAGSGPGLTPGIGRRHTYGMAVTPRVVRRLRGGTSALDLDTEEGRAFLQERVAFFNKVAFCISGAFFVVAAFAGPYYGGPEPAPAPRGDARRQPGRVAGLRARALAVGRPRWGRSTPPRWRSSSSASPRRRSSCRPPSPARSRARWC